MRTFAQKPKATQTVSTKPTIPGRAHFGQSLETNSILHLQRTIGNQAARRRLETGAEEINTRLTGTASPHFGHVFSRIPISPPTAGAIQMKLAINIREDEYEQEADRVAEQVTGGAPAQLRRACECGGTRTHGQSSPQHALAIVGDVLSSPGQALEPAARSYMEGRFGREFGNVRVHTDERAQESADPSTPWPTPSGTTLCSAPGNTTPQRERAGACWRTS